MCCWCARVCVDLTSFFYYSSKIVGQYHWFSILESFRRLPPFIHQLQQFVLFFCKYGIITQKKYKNKNDSYYSLIFLYQLLYYNISDIYNKINIFSRLIRGQFCTPHAPHCPACTVYSFFDGFFHFSFLYPNSMRISLLTPPTLSFTYTFQIYIYTSYIM